MRISNIGIAALKGIPGLMQKVAELENVSLRTVQRWVKDDHDPLTKAAVVRLIKDETGLTDEQILEAVALTA